MSSHRHQGGESFELVIVAQANDAPPISRLRMVLKGLLRAHGFRRTSCRDVTPKWPPAAPGVAQAAAEGPSGQDETAAGPGSP